MKKLVLPILALSLLFISCDKDDSQDVNPPQEQVVGDEIPFLGTWSRTFQAGPATPTATYTVTEGSITYNLANGPGGALEYTMDKKYFSTENNRFIGLDAENNKFYIVFVKDITETSITLYKQEVASIEEGMSLEVPAPDTTEHYGWNVYDKM